MNSRSVFERLRPDRLSGQITFLILAAIIIFQAIVIILFHVLDVEGRRHIVAQTDFVASVILSMDVAPVSERESLLSELSRAAPYANLTIRNERPKALSSVDYPFAKEIRDIRSRLWSGADVFPVSEPRNDASETLGVGLRKGGYALVSIAQHRKPSRSVWRWLLESDPDVPFLLTPWARAALLFLMCTTILVLWTSKSIVAPLINLAWRAEQFPDESDTDGALLPERGPREVRELTRAINRMQTRIRAMIAARTHVLAAVSHDLRTIITRLNLTAEFVSDGGLRSKLLRDIGLMDAMLYKNLQHLRYIHSDSSRSDRSLIDLDSVLQTVADQFCDMGHKVTYRGGQHQPMLGSLTEMQRDFTNLVENATHHARNVEISIEDLPDNRIQVDVADDGPGIPDEKKAAVFEPFVRGQPGRTIDNQSGFGLGLSIVRSLVENHGGTVRLLDREPTGLVARVILPRAFGGEERRLEDHG